MAMRVTTSMAMNTYRYNLQASMVKTNDSRNKVLTQRNFNSYSEDPVGATLAFKLRRSYYSNSSQIANSKALIGRFESAWTSMGNITTRLEETSTNSVIRGANSPTGPGRVALGKVLDEMANSIVENLNIKYGDHFVFGGDDALKVPFTWDEKSGELLYRGVNVNAGAVKHPDDLKLTPGTKEYDEAMEAYNKDQEDLAKLKEFAKEDPVFIDLGMGFQEEGRGDMITSSAFDSALPGIGALGFGVDKDGLPNNLVTVIKQLDQIFSRCTTNEGDYATDGKTLNESYATDDDYQTMLKLMDKYKQCMSDFNNSYTELDSKATYLRTNLERLETEKVTLNEQILDVEQIDLADAIIAFSWDQFCYNSALKVGNQLLSQSLLDYMG